MENKTTMRDEVIISRKEYDELICTIAAIRNEVGEATMMIEEARKMIRDRQAELNEALEALKANR